MSFREHVLRGVVLFALACAVAACGSSNELPPTSNMGSANGPALNLRPVTDIPIPPGVKYDTERSLILSEADRWTGRLVMDSPMNNAEAFAFYKAQMPNFGWMPVMSVQSKVSVLTYMREDRAATIQIESGSFTGTDVIITIAPRNSDIGGGPATQTPYATPAPVIGR